MHQRFSNERWTGTDVSVGQGDGLHEVHSLGEHLHEGEDVTSFDRIAQRVQPGRRVRTLLPGEALLGVLGHDEVLPRLPVGGHERAVVSTGLTKRLAGHGAAKVCASSSVMVPF